MSGKFDVFDSWGNKIGEFVPSNSGDGCLTSIIVILVIAILWTVGFLFYCVYWLAAKGVAAAKEGKWFEALVWWAIPIALVVGSMLTITHSVNRHQEELAEMEFKRNLPHLVQVGNVRAVKCRNTDYPCPPGSGDQIYVLFTVVNPTSIHFDLKARITNAAWGGYGPLEEMGSIEPGQTKELWLDVTYDWKTRVRVDSNNKITCTGGDCAFDVVFRSSVRDDICLRTILRELSPR